jgi:glycosyltransferase involved in cell wall biosynthesis
MEKNKRTPLVTVFMPVYNSQKNLGEAIESILNQTFFDFEFLIVDDGSTDSSEEIIKNYKDQRIRLVKNEKNLKLALTRNKGLELAEGKFIVMMDSDDVSYPDRIQRLVDFMKENPQAGVCGSGYEIFGNSVKSKKVIPPLTHEDITAGLFWGCPLHNPTTIIRKSFFESHNLKYDLKYQLMYEDYDLWLRACVFFELRCIPDILYRYRIIPTSTTQKNNSNLNFLLSEIFVRNYKNLGINIDKDNREFFLSIIDIQYKPGKKLLNEAEKAVLRLIEANNSTQRYNRDYFRKWAFLKWQYLCYDICPGIGMFTFFKFITSPLSKQSKFRPGFLLKLFIKCMVKYR